MMEILDQRIWPNVDAYLPDFCNTSTTDLHSGELEDLDAAYRSLRDRGYFGLAVPKEFSGSGIGTLESCAIQMRIALADAGLAVALNMHLFTIAILVEHFERERDISWALLEAIATQNRVVASAFAEPGLAGCITRSTITAETDGSDLVLSGTKAPCSLALRSDLVCLQFEKRHVSGNKLCIALVPTNMTGLSVVQTWRGVGLKSSESDTIELRECRIPDQLVFFEGDPGKDASGTFAAGIVRFSLLTTVVYIALAKKALRIAVSDMQRSPIPGGSMRSDSSSFRESLGDVLGPIVALETACAGIAAQIDAGQAAEKFIVNAMSLKHVSIDACDRAMSVAMELTGGRSYGEEAPLFRLVADSKAILFHPPTRFVTRKGLGGYWIDGEYDFDLNGVIDRK
jgi:alkylation response protein AidB-like acyl-CoA dehydrogenase